MEHQSGASTSMLRSVQGKRLQPRKIFSVQAILYHLRTLYLFTASDHSTFVLPEALFGICCALSKSAVIPTATGDSEVFGRIPQVLLWTWLNTLVFVFSNQGSTRAIIEDRLNKPWRPLPAGRLKLEQVQRLQAITIPLVLALTYFVLGGFEETAVLFCLTWMYNDLGTSDHFISRDLTIAAAYFFYGSGAVRVASGHAFEPLTMPAILWLLIASLIILTTVPVQDLKDQEGDKLRNRKTLPIAIGEKNTRRYLAVTIELWSWVCCAFWGLGPISSAFILLFGVLLSSRLVFKGGIKAGRATWHLWSFWLMSIYLMPVMKRLEGSLHL